MKKAWFIDSQIIAILKMAENGIPGPVLCRENDTSIALFYQWRSKYGGMDISWISL